MPELTLRKEKLSIQSWDLSELIYSIVDSRLKKTEEQIDRLENNLTALITNQVNSIEFDDISESEATKRIINYLLEFGGPIDTVDISERLKVEYAPSDKILTKLYEEGFISCQ